MVRALLRLEGLAVLGVAAYVFRAGGGSWLWFGVWFLAPDLAMLGYLAGPRIGSAVYNFVHTYAAAVALAAGGLWLRMPLLLLAGCVLAAHIGMDRVLGYGLKYPTAFKDTHIQRV